MDRIGRYAGRNEHDARPGAGLAQQAQPVQAAHAGQLDVQQHQVGIGQLQCAGFGNRARLGNRAHAGVVLHDQAQPGAKQVVVVHQQKAGSHTATAPAQTGMQHPPCLGMNRLPELCFA